MAGIPPSPTPPKPPHHHAPGSPVFGTLKAILRTRITAGLLVVLPLYITWLLINVVFDILRSASLWAVELYLTNTPYGRAALERWGIEASKLSNEGFNALPPMLQWSVSIVSVALTIGALYAIGVFAANIAGRRMIYLFELLLEKLPIVKTVYRASKQILEALTMDQSKSFKSVALVPFPDESMRSVGFVTSMFRDSLTGEELVTVFIPTTPNPTTGYLQILKRGDLVDVPWTFEEAIRIIMSGGILRPDYLTMVREKHRHDVLEKTGRIGPGDPMPEPGEPMPEPGEPLPPTEPGTDAG